MKAPVLDITGKETGRAVELSDTVFAIEPNEHAIYLDVKQYLAHQRQGTHKAKERGEITGSTRKLRKQKGSGAARVGSIKSPIFRGGGRIFGPRPRDYYQKLNKNVKRLARKSALSQKSKEQSLIVVEDFTLEAPKTKDFIAILNALGVENKKSLIVLGSTNNTVYLSSRNLKRSEVITISELNTYKIVNAKNLILTESALEGIELNLK